MCPSVAFSPRVPAEGGAILDDTAPSRPGFAEFIRLFARIGCLSFGGPAGQIALMHRLVVDERRWVGEDEYLHALSFCHLLPGPEAQQLATWIGWRLHGVRGGIGAGLLFILPGAAIMLALSIVYGFAAGQPWFTALFLGIKAAVVAIVLQALLRIAGRSLDTRFKKAVAVAAFLALAVFDLPFPLVVLGSGAVGILVATTRPGWLGLSKAAHGTGERDTVPYARLARTAVVWTAIWIAPLLAVFAILGPEHVLWDVGLFFAQLAMVTFGGAYAVLAYMAQEAVQGFGWLDARAMADGLGLAETTPGPLILVTQFVGYIAAFRAPEPFSPLVAGVLGAALTTWVTFAPCFLWIFTFAPLLDRLRQAQRLRGGLATLTAAVVGVIASLALWFALHVVFARVEARRLGPLALDVPELASVDWRALAIVGLALILVFRFGAGPFGVLMVAAAAGLLLGLAI